MVCCLWCLRLFYQYQTVFLTENPDLHGILTETAEYLTRSGVGDTCKDMQEAHSAMVQAIQSCEVMEKMAQFDVANGKPLQVVMRQCMQMLMEMLMFIRSVRTADWNLLVVSVQKFTKHFFALDKRSYARLMPLYLADMELLRQSDPNSLLRVVNKNRCVAFCAVGADYALEHINRSMRDDHTRAGQACQRGLWRKIAACHHLYRRIIMLSQLHWWTDKRTALNTL